MQDILVNCFEGVCLPRKRVIRSNVRLDMTTAVYRGRKTTPTTTVFAWANLGPPVLQDINFERISISSVFYAKTLRFLPNKCEEILLLQSKISSQLFRNKYYLS